MSWFDTPLWKKITKDIEKDKESHTEKEERDKLKIQHIVLSERQYKDGYYEVIIAVKTKGNKLKISVEEYIPHPSLEGIGGYNENLQQVDSDSPDYNKYTTHSRYLYGSKVVEKFHSTNTQIKGSW